MHKGLNYSEALIRLIILYTYMLPAKWIRQANPFRQAQIPPADGTMDEHQHLGRIYKRKYV